MDYFVNTMNDENVVSTSEYSRNSFITAVEKASNGEVTYADSNVKKSIQMLVDRNCLIKKARGVYIVNPQMYFNPRKSQEDRMNSIKMVLEFKAGVDGIDLRTEYGNVESLNCETKPE
jgi:hypothetical protein